MGFAVTPIDEYSIAIDVTGTEYPYTLWEYDVYQYAQDNPPGLVLFDGIIADGASAYLQHYVAPADEGHFYSPAHGVPPVEHESNHIFLLFDVSSSAPGDLKIEGSYAGIDAEGNVYSEETIAITGASPPAYTSQYRWSQVSKLTWTPSSPTSTITLKCYQKRLGIISRQLRSPRDIYPYFYSLALRESYFCYPHLAFIYVNSGATFMVPDGSNFILDPLNVLRGKIIRRPSGTLRIGGYAPGFGAAFSATRIEAQAPTNGDYGSTEIWGGIMKTCVQLPKGNIYNCVFQRSESIPSELEGVKLILGRAGGTETVNAKNISFLEHGAGGQSCFHWWANNPNITIENIDFQTDWGFFEAYGDNNNADKIINGVSMPPYSNAPLTDKPYEPFYFYTPSRRHFILRNTKRFRSLAEGSYVKIGFTYDEHLWHPMLFHKSTLNIYVRREWPHLDEEGADTNWKNLGYSKAISQTALPGATVRLYDSNGNSVFRQDTGVYWTAGTGGDYIQNIDTQITLSGQLAEGYYWIDEEMIYISSCASTPPYTATIQRSRAGTTETWHNNKIEANRHLYSIVNSKTTNVQGKVTHDLTFAYSDLGTWAGATGNRLSGGHKVCYYPFTLVISLDGFEPHYQKIFNWDASLTLVQHDLIDTDLNIVLQPLRPVFDNLSG